MDATLKRWLFDPVVARLLTAVVAILVTVTAVRLVRRFLASRITHTDARYRVRKLVSFAGYVAVLLILSVIYSSQLGGLTVALGVAGAGVAFALQEVIASVAGWFAVTFSNFYNPGDRVQLGGIKGDVIDIGILRTTVMELGQWVDGDLYNGRIVRIANSFVFKEPVFNYSADFPFLWDEIKIPIRFGADLRLARELLERVADQVVGDFSRSAALAWNALVRKYLIEDARVTPMVTLIANDNWLEFTVRYVVDYRRRRATKDALFTRILEEIELTAGKVQMASATFELVAAPPFKMTVAGGAAEPR
ncbi:MAG: mechanosensitive ion channel domain-containing protein [Gemmatimonadota bacterium]